MASLQKNVAGQNFTFCMVSATTGGADSSATVTVKVTKDNGTQASGGGTVTNSGNGQYNYAPTQAETNATDVGFLMTASGDIPVNFDFHTDPGVMLTAGTGTNQISLSSGLVTVGTNNDKTGYSLTQTFPTNFSSLAITVGGAVTVGTNNDKTGYSLTQSFPANFASLVINSDGTVQSDLEKIADVALSTHAAGMVPADVRDILGSAVSTTSAQLGVNVVNIAGQAAALDTNNLLKVDVEDINGNATAAQNVSKANQAIGRGTCTTGGSTTSIPTSAFSPGGAGIVSGQFIGRTIIFDANTTTAALQGQASNITANTSGASPTFTVTALTNAPASGDTFSVV